MSVSLPPFQALLDAHGRDVHRFLVATVGRVDADDCYQETWLAALRAYPRLRADSNLRAWVMTVAHSKAMDHLRRARRTPIPVDEVLDRPAPPAGEPGIDGVWERVAALPEKQRAAVALRFLIDAGYPEISAAMGTSEAAARRNVHEGLKRLRKELA
jgi:RNA polymerase sigma factor (sigma-70 family)